MGLVEGHLIILITLNPGPLLHSILLHLENGPVSRLAKEILYIPAYVFHITLVKGLHQGKSQTVRYKAA